MGIPEGLPASGTSGLRIIGSLVVSLAFVSTDKDKSVICEGDKSGSFLSRRKYSVEKPS
jgi:hypothetical protein